MMIYLGFKPMAMNKKDFVDIPLFEIKNFDMYELSRVGLKTILSGTSSKRYEERYTIENMDYTDNSREFIANMQADDGIYTQKKVSLHGNVRYVREDGLTFESEDAFYNKKSSTIFTDNAYVAYQGKNTLKGTSLKYNNLTKKIESKNIRAVYQLTEREK